MNLTKTSDPLLADLIAHAKPVSQHKIEELFIPSCEFASLNVNHEWMIKDVLVRYEPMILGGPKKVLKTSVSLELAISLAAGFNGKFLDRFEVPRPYRVGLISGESGMPSLKQKALAICKAKGLNLADLPIHWKFKMPQLSIPSQQAALAEEVQENGLEVLIFDPMYLALLSTESTINAGNVLQMGPLLQKVVDTCLPYGCTPVLVHHTKKLGHGDSRRPLDLDDLSQSGFAEFARQWLLLSRRTDYEDGSGIHKIWMRTGGSAGHGGLWGLDINEGKKQNGLVGAGWSVDIKTPKELETNKIYEKEQANTAKEEKIIKRLIKHLEISKCGDTKTGIKDGLKLNSENATKAINNALEMGLIEHGNVQKNGRKLDGFVIAKSKGIDNPDKPDKSDGQS